MGRKGIYQDWISDEGLLKIEGWAKDGLIDEQIADNIGINRKTLYEWKKKYPPISDALKTGKEVADRKVENALFKNAMGYEYTEVKEYIEQTDDGKKKKKIEKTTKHVPANTTAQIFWLKNRKPKQWRDKQDIEHSGGLNITVDWGEEDEG
jgi:DNA-binding XRE family transcriptional regulator